VRLALALCALLAVRHAACQQICTGLQYNASMAEVGLFVDAEALLPDPDARGPGSPVTHTACNAGAFYSPAFASEYADWLNAATRELRVSADGAVALAACPATTSALAAGVRSLDGAGGDLECFESWMAGVMTTAYLPDGQVLGDAEAATAEPELDWQAINAKPDGFPPQYVAEMCRLKAIHRTVLRDCAADLRPLPQEWLALVPAPPPASGGAALRRVPALLAALATLALLL
jgi:hypothetical protein